MPFHGEYRMLKRHADIAVMCDIPKENTFVLSNGEVLNIKNGIVTKGEVIQAGDTYVDGNRIGDVDNVVMKERKMMSQDGIIIITLGIEGNKLISNPAITTRGFVLVNDNIELLHSLELRCKKIIENKLSQNKTYNEIRTALIAELSTYINESIGRNPTIMPVIMDVKRKVTQKNL